MASAREHSGPRLIAGNRRPTARRGQPGCGSASICRNHDAIRFQLALFWSTK